MYLAPYFSQAYSANEWTNVCQETNTYSDRIEWKFESAGDGYYYIRSQFYNNDGWYMNVQNAGTGNGTLIGVSKNKTNTDELFKLVDLNGQKPRQMGQMPLPAVQIPTRLTKIIIITKKSLSAATSVQGFQPMQ